MERAGPYGAPQAQGTFPDKPVRIICDSAPGSATDVVVRLMGGRLSTIWGQQAVVDNRPGGGGAHCCPRRPDSGSGWVYALCGKRFDLHRTQGRAGRRAEPADRATARFLGDRFHQPAANVHCGGAHKSACSRCPS